jgi:hypothetical protein
MMVGSTLKRAGKTPAQSKLQQVGLISCSAQCGKRSTVCRQTISAIASRYLSPAVVDVVPDLLGRHHSTPIIGWRDMRHRFVAVMGFGRV